MLLLPRSCAITMQAYVAFWMMYSYATGFTGNVAMGLWERWRSPPETFEQHPFGLLEFESGLGWLGTANLGGQQVQVIFGSDGERPTEQMSKAVRDIQKDWHSLKRTIGRFVDDRLSQADWAEEPHLPAGAHLVPNSVQALWRDRPDTIIIEFSAGDDERIWHITLEQGRPAHFGFDH